MRNTLRKHHKLLLSIFMPLVLGARLDAQRLLQISGRLTDGETSQPLPEASIKIPELEIATTTSLSGEFKINAIAELDTVTVCFSHLGFQEIRVKMLAYGHKALFFSLQPSDHVLGEVEINATQNIDFQKLSPVAPTFSLTAKDAKNLPALLGEADILKVLQLKPGMAAGAEGNVGLNVRGGNIDQNLLLLDGATVYNAAHLFGFMSNFNTDAVRDLNAWKSGFPAQFGGRLSSVIAVRSRDGDFQKTQVRGGLGLVSSRVSVEGPIWKDKISWILSGRRTYVDLITNQLNKRKSEREKVFHPIPSYHFDDLNGKVSWKPSEKDQVSGNFFLSRDNFEYQNIDFDFNFRWRNQVGSLNWKHLFREGNFVQTSFSRSKYALRLRDFAPGFSVNVKSGIQDWTLKSDFVLKTSENRTFRFGWSGAFYEFNAGEVSAGSDDGSVNLGSGERKKGLETAVYFSDEFSIGERFRANSGLRVSSFSDFDRTYFASEPRLNLVFSASPNLYINGNYTRMNQYLHQLSGSGFSFPADVWYPSTKVVLPEISDQVGIGASWKLPNQLIFNWEMYYKWMHNQIDLRDGGQIFGAMSIENEIALGNGRAFAASEIELEKKTGRVQGWLGYTFAKVQKGGFSEIDNGASFSPRHDIRHNLSGAVSYRLNKRFSLSGTMIYRSGTWAWLPVGRFTLQNVPGGASPGIVPVFAERNTFRFPHFFRADLAAIFNFKTKHGEQDLTLSIHNATNRRNPYFYYLSAEYETMTAVDGKTYKVPKRIKASPVYLFPVLPSLTWNFKF